MTRERVRWGILGVAKINERLIPAFQKAANAELAAIASRSPEKAQRAAGQAGIPIALAGYEALLEDSRVDAVYIPLPNHLHAEWTRKAAERGKHILCEKPLAASAAEAEQVIAFCRQRNIRLMEGFMWPHHPRTAKLRQLLDAGVIGEVRRITSAFTFQLELEPKNIRLHSEMAGGSVMDVGCYPIYGARWAFVAEPIRIYTSAEWHHGVDVTMNGVIEFPGGRTALFDCGFTLPFRCDVEIVGTMGVIRVPDMWLPPPRAVFHVRRDNVIVEEVVVEGEDQIVHMIQNFSTAILEGRDVEPSPDEAVATLKVLDAARQSARQQRAVAIN